VDYGSRSGRCFNIFGSNNTHLVQYDCKPNNKDLGWVPPTGWTPGHISFTARDGMVWNDTIKSEARGKLISEKNQKHRSQDYKYPNDKQQNDQKKKEQKYVREVSHFLNTWGLTQTAKELGLSPRPQTSRESAKSSPAANKKGVTGPRPPPARWPPSTTTRVSGTARAQTTRPGRRVAHIEGPCGGGVGSSTARMRASTTGMPRGGSSEEWRSAFVHFAEHKEKELECKAFGRGTACTGSNHPDYYVTNNDWEVPPNRAGVLALDGRTKVW